MAESTESGRSPAEFQREAELLRAFELLGRTVDLAVADRLCPAGANAVFTTSVTLWMLVFQRMNTDSTLEAAVQRLLANPPPFLPTTKRTGQLSDRTGGYSRARQRLPLEMVNWLCEQVAQSLIDVLPASFAGRRVFVIDGTTVTLAPEPALRQAFPPAKNQHGRGAWPVAQLVMCHELASGTALAPEIGPKCGPHAVSETTLIHRHLDRLPGDAIVMADAGFGILGVAYAVKRSGRDFVLRLSAQRWHALVKRATLISNTAAGRTYALTWRPTAAEQLKWGLSDDVALEVWLHEIPVHDGLTVYLVTSLPQSAAELGALYQQRGEIEIDIRNFKIVLGGEHLPARSLEMFQKELLGSVIAYNLVTQFRRQAAKKAGVEPRDISFKRTWTTFLLHLLNKTATTAEQWQAAYDRALGYAAGHKLPNRPGRSYPRETYTRRDKSVSFQKREPRGPTHP
jgi:hypothetical protein